MPGIRWINLFLDVPAELIDESAAFWTSALGATLSPWRGDGHQFVTLIPKAGAPWLRLQAVQDEHFSVHLDFVVDDTAEFGRHALELGAQHVLDGPGVTVYKSPAGVPFCVSEDGMVEGEVQDRSVDQLADQVCFDLSHQFFDHELAFWSELTGWPVRQSPRHREFVALERPAGMPVRISFQRTHHSEPSGHLDVFSPRRMDAVAKHRSAGAHEFARNEWWTVMVTPSGQHYCIADSDGRREEHQQEFSSLTPAAPQ